ncbi:MAG: class I SAM-dependent methyltransferase [Acidobacteriota bacterium]
MEVRIFTMTDEGNPVKGSDPYSRVDYRRFVAWKKRIRREWPLLRRLLESAPERSVLDCGCATGEHCRFLAEKGYRVVGLDRSESMIARARQEQAPPNLHFVVQEMQEVGGGLETTFGAAICLGNTLVHLKESGELSRFLSGLAQVMREGGIFLFQVLNYERIFKQGIRHLPLNFRPEGEGEIIFLRLMEPLEDGRVRFCPTTLRYDPHGDPPLQLVRSRIVELRGWRSRDLLPALEKAGFQLRSLYGDMRGGLFEAEVSHDLVVVAQRRGPDRNDKKNSPG